MKKNDNFKINIPEIEKTIGYTFRDKSLLIQAFTRTSFCNEHKGASGVTLQSNEVLEFFGDSVLSVAIISLLLKDCTDRYQYGIRTQLNEGDFSNIKSKLSDKKNLSETTFRLGLEKFLRVGEGDMKLGISNEPSVMEDLFESIIGAIYIDTDMNIMKVTEVVSGILDTASYVSSAPPIQSAKNALQEWCADKKRRMPTPVYKTLSEDGPDHKKIFERGCYIDGKLVGRGKGKNQKLADAAAAEQALSTLKAEEALPSERTDQQHNTTASKTAKVMDITKKKQTFVNKSPKPSAPKRAQSDKGASDNSKRKNTVQKHSATVKKTAIPAASRPTALLKEYALSRKAVTPSFKDLGSAPGNGRTEYRIECSFMGISAIGVSDTRLGARESAAGMIVKELSADSKKKAAANIGCSATKKK